jgi:hypothetical protein
MIPPILAVPQAGGFLSAASTADKTFRSQVWFGWEDAIDSEVANDPHSTANAAVPAGFAGLPPAERFISNLEINRTCFEYPPLARKRERGWG